MCLTYCFFSLLGSFVPKDWKQNSRVLNTSVASANGPGNCHGHQDLTWKVNTEIFPPFLTSALDYQSSPPAYYLIVPYIDIRNHLNIGLVSLFKHPCKLFTRPPVSQFYLSSMERPTDATVSLLCGFSYVVLISWNTAYCSPLDSSIPVQASWGLP